MLETKIIEHFNKLSNINEENLLNSIQGLYGALHSPPTSHAYDLVNLTLDYDNNMFCNNVFTIHGNNIKIKCINYKLLQYNIIIVSKL